MTATELGPAPTPVAVIVVKITWGTVMAVLIVTVLLELVMVSPTSLVQGTTVVTTTSMVVREAEGMGAAVTVNTLVMVSAPVAMPGLVGTNGAQIPWK
jgi:hypothetical protein